MQLYPLPSVIKTSAYFFAWRVTVRRYVLPVRLRLQDKDQLDSGLK